MGIFWGNVPSVRNNWKWWLFLGWKYHVWITQRTDWTKFEVFVSVRMVTNDHTVREHIWEALVQSKLVGGIKIEQKLCPRILLKWKKRDVPFSGNIFHFWCICVCLIYIIFDSELDFNTKESKICLVNFFYVFSLHLGKNGNYFLSAVFKDGVFCFQTDPSDKHIYLWNLILSFPGSYLL